MSAASSGQCLPGRLWVGDAGDTPFAAGQLDSTGCGGDGPALGGRVLLVEVTATLRQCLFVTGDRGNVLVRRQEGVVDRRHDLSNDGHVPVYEGVQRGGDTSFNTVLDRNHTPVCGPIGDGLDYVVDRITESDVLGNGGGRAV